MAVQIPFPLPSSGYALNSKVRVNLDFLVEQFNQFNTGTATWDQVSIGTANNLTGTLTFYNDSNANYLTFQPGATAANTTFTLPTGVPSTTGKFLTSTTGGVMSWSLLSEKTSYVGNQLIYADGLGVLQELAPGSGNKVLVNASPPQFFDLTGTSNQVTVTPSAGAFTFSTPQDLATTSNVQFARVKANAGTSSAPSLYFASSSSNVAGIYAASDGTAVNIQAGTALGNTVFSADNTGLATASSELRAPTLRATTALKVSTSTGSIVTIQGLSSSFGDYTLTLPPDDGSSGQALTTDGSGVLTWASPAGTGANTALSNLASVAINAHLLPGSADAVDLGSSSLPYLNTYTGLIQVGRAGFAGTIALYPATSNKGSTTFTMSDCAGSTITNLNFALQAGARTYTVPDAGGSASFVMTAGTQTITGATTFAGNIAFSSPSTQGIVGTTSNDAAATGNVGQYIESIISSAANFPATSTWGDLTSISLTAGDWDVDLIFDYNNAGGVESYVTIGISQTSGNSATGLVTGSNRLEIDRDTTGNGISATISNYRQALSGTTTIYAKYQASYTGTAPVARCRLSARRRR